MICDSMPRGVGSGLGRSGQQSSEAWPTQRSRDPRTTPKWGQHPVDSDHFDALARALSERNALRSRRGALTTLLASGLSLLAFAGTTPGEVSARSGKRQAIRRRRGGDRVAVEGLCGNGDPKKNRCQRHGQCCTGYCRKQRCRCRRAGDVCSEDRNCCPGQQGLSCQDGVCRPPASGCNAATCEGCCAGERCLDGSSHTACGTGGAQCLYCPASAPICGVSQPGVCGLCVRRTCAEAGATCGPASNGCGGTIDCGVCTAPDICGGGGVPNQCGSGGTCTPHTCAQEGVQCGLAGDGCGGVVTCAPCANDSYVSLGHAGDM